MVSLFGLNKGNLVHTFYFKAVEDTGSFKFIAFRGDSTPFFPVLGDTYGEGLLYGLVALGHRVVIDPSRKSEDATPQNMYYAKGYRGSILNVKQAIDRLFESVGWSGSNLVVSSDRCAEDFGDRPSNTSVPERETPGIGPLPPQAPLVSNPCGYHKIVSSPSDGFDPGGSIPGHNHFGLEYRSGCKACDITNPPQTPVAAKETEHYKCHERCVTPVTESERLQTELEPLPGTMLNPRDSYRTTSFAFDPVSCIFEPKPAEQLKIGLDKQFPATNPVLADGLELNMFVPSELSYANYKPRPEVPGRPTAKERRRAAQEVWFRRNHFADNPFQYALAKFWFSVKRFFQESIGDDGGTT